MGKEIVINAQKDQMRIAIVEDGELAEMYFEDPNNERTLGDIHLGRVRRIMPSIKAAFIDVGQQSDAFLHFSDIADNIGDLLKLVDMKNPDVSEVELSDSTRAARRHRPRAPMGAPVSLTNEEDDEEEDAVAENRKPARPSRTSRPSRSGGKSSSRDVRPESILKRDQKILVKIVKEPISAKGSRVSTDISLAGRFLVLVPLADYVAVSKKIVSYKERRRLRALATSLLPKGFGLIVRTVAEGKDAKTLDTDLRLLIDKWRRIESRMAEVKDPPALMHQDVNMVSSVIRDLFSDDYDRILCDDQKVYRNIKGYIQAVAPQMAPAVQLHTDRIPVFKAAKIDRAVSLAFESRVPLPTGGYLIIEHTEAMHVVDVNSGRAGKGLSQENNSLKVNLESARMIAQQLRIRDLGGIIVVDFIDLRDDKNRRKVYDELRREFTKDRAVTKVLPMSDFGVVQITRQRLRPSITTKKSTADAMKGLASTEDSHAETVGDTDTGEQLSVRGRRDKPAVTPIEMTAKIDKWLARHKENGNSGPLVLKVHPFARAFLQRGIFNAGRRWFAKYFIRIRVEEDDTLEPMVFRIFDPKTNEELTRRKRSGRRRGKRKSDSESADDQTDTTSKDSATTKSRDDGRDRKKSDDQKRSRQKSDERRDGRGRSKRNEGRADQSDQKSGETGERSRSGDKPNKSRSGRGEKSTSARSSRGQRGGRSGRDSDTRGEDNADSKATAENQKTERRGRDADNRGSDNRGSDNRDSDSRDSGSRDSRGRSRGGRRGSSRGNESNQQSAETGDQNQSGGRSGRGRQQSTQDGGNEGAQDSRSQGRQEDGSSSPGEERKSSQRGADRSGRSENRRSPRGKDSTPRDTHDAGSDATSADTGRGDLKKSSDSGDATAKSGGRSARKVSDRSGSDSSGNGHSGDSNAGSEAPARPEKVLFVSRHDSHPESTPAAKVAKPAKITTDPVSDSGSDVGSTEVKAKAVAKETPKSPPKLYTSQHAPRKDSGEGDDSH